MKKILLATFTLLVMIAFTNQSNAQLEARAGLVMAKLKTNLFGISASSDAKLGAQLGATYNKAINDNFSIRPGLMYTMKGGSGEDDSGQTESGTLGYIGIPLDFVYSTPIQENTLSFHIGPYIDYLLHGTDGATDVFNSTDFGYNVGAGFNFGKFGVGVNLSTGLSKTSSEEIEDIGLGGLFSLGEIYTKNKFTSLYFTYAL